MRAPRRRRPPLRRIASPAVESARLATLAEQVSYVGSPEHKDMPSFAGHPRPRRDASICPQSLTADLAKISGWLSEAFRRGAVGELWEGGFPRYVWYKDGGDVYEGRLVNRGLGQYKGYPLEPAEWPEGIEKLYGEFHD